MSLVWFLWCLLSSPGIAVDSGWPGDTVAYGAYYENLEWDYEVKGERLSVKVTATLRVLNPRGQELSELSLWESPFRGVDHIKIEVSNALGKKVYSRRKGDMTKVCGYGSAGELFSDICHYMLELPSPGYPYTIKYQYRIKSDYLFQPEPAVLQRSVPVHTAKCYLSVPKDHEFYHKVYGLDIAPLVTQSDAKTQYEWRVDEVPAMSTAGYQPEDIAVPARIVFMPRQFSFDGLNCSGWSWKDIGLWYRSLAAGRYSVGLPTKAQDPLALEADQAIRSAYNSVIDHNRYVAVEIGIGGWQPHFASWTEERGYGDCKDLTTLLISYLQMHEIQSYPVLVLTRGSGVLDPQFPNVDFNHVITMAVAKRDTFWMDPTCNLCPFGDIPYSDEGIYGLAVTDSGGVLVRVPSSASGQNVIHRETSLRILPDRTVTIDLLFTATGNPAQYIRAHLKEADRLVRSQFAKLLCCGDLNSCSLGSVEVRALENREQPVEISIAARTLKPISSFN